MTGDDRRDFYAEQAEEVMTSVTMGKRKSKKKGPAAAAPGTGESTTASQHYNRAQRRARRSPLDEKWREWLRSNFDRGVPPDELFQNAALHGYDLEEISAELGGYHPIKSNMNGKPLSDAVRLWLQNNLGKGCAAKELFESATRNGFDPGEVSRELGGYRPQDDEGGTEETDSTNGRVSPSPFPLTDSWRKWFRTNLERGCTPDLLFKHATDDGLDPDEVSRELGGYRPSSGLWHDLYHAALTNKENRPRAWRLDTDLAQVYEIPGVLSDDECAAMIKIIDSSLENSQVTQGPDDFRTSRTCHMSLADSDVDMIHEIEERLSSLIGCNPSCSEPIQGQCYGVGEYFKAHADWFEPDSDEYVKHASMGGQRTWTVMVYLNNVTEGGTTRFEKIGRDFAPIRGTAIAWNNLNINGSPNQNTLHEAMPVLEGKKYVITKWFREKPGYPRADDEDLPAWCAPFDDPPILGDDQEDLN